MTASTRARHRIVAATPSAPPKTRVGVASPALRAGAASLALLCVLGELTSLGHMLLTRHVVCPEHGELIHATELASTHVAAQPPTAEVTWTRAPNAGHAHDHCGLACTHRVSAVPVSPAIALSTPPCSRGAESPHQAPNLRDGRDLHRLAPKQSPPV